jgi:hypothetical protein
MNGIAWLLLGIWKLLGPEVRRGKRRLLLCQEVENETPVVWYVWKRNKRRTNSWSINEEIKWRELCKGK